MHWELWIVPVIALFVWIISQFRGSEEPSKNARPSSTGTESPPSRPGGEIDKFRQELERMRRKQEEERRARAQLPEVIPVALPVTVERAEPVRQPPPSPPVYRHQQPKQRPRPRPTEVARPVAAKVTASPSVGSALPVALPAPVTVPPPIAGVKPRPVSPAIEQLGALIRSPKTLQAAFLLHEVLGPPRCRRHAPRG